jgi:hypothetical protein
MSQITTFPTWTGRTSTRTIGENLVHLHFKATAGQLADADDGTDWVNGEHIGLFEIPFGSIIHSCKTNVTVAAGGAALADIGVLGFTSYLDGAFTDNASTGNDVNGLQVSLDLNSATVQTGAGALLCRKLDETIFSDADELGKPLYITMEGQSVSTTNPSLVALEISIILQTP